MQDYWFISDLHLDHANIKKWYPQRPGNSLEEMNEILIANINERVKPNDILVFGGDFSFGRWDYLHRLNGQIYYIIGNHDKYIGGYENRKQFTNVIWWGDLREFKIDGQYVSVCHYLMNSWNKSCHGAWHLYGHHHSDVSQHSIGKTMNLCVDVMGYYPVNWEMVKEHMNSRPDNWDLVRKS